MVKRIVVAGCRDYNIKRGKKPQNNFSLPVFFIMTYASNLAKPLYDACAVGRFCLVERQSV